MDSWSEHVVTVTEKFLTYRKKRNFIAKEKQKKKHPVVDWLEALLWAAVVVLLINQYIFQAYQIPSGSMKNTLLIKDRIFVNKIVYGPELIPGMFKIPGLTQPSRGEVITFESPTYLSKGPVFDIVQRLLYMVTLSFVDIDKDENGNPKPHFLIKRAIGVEKDSIRFVQGDVEIKPEGFLEWMPEKEYQQLSNSIYPVQRFINQKDYTTIKADSFATAYKDSRIPANPTDLNILTDSHINYQDKYTWSTYRYQSLYSINPQERRYGSAWRRFDTGWYIPEGWIFPLGDNRDNSKDARYFGPVHIKNVLGRAMFKYWPLNRIGSIK